MFKDEITISMQEYKELLVIKGKYEEMKRQQELITYTPFIKSEDYKLPQTIFTSTPMPEPPYKITCNKEE